jgi:hypothetical protein
MKTKNISKQLLIFPFLLIIPVCIMSCEEDDEDSKNQSDTNQIVPGAWKANAEFGTIDFIVNSESTYIIEFEVDFDNWTMGITTYNNSIRFSSDPGWKITDRKFSFSQNLSPFPSEKEEFTINGTFNDKGDKAEGSWEADFNGLTDSGNWQGAPKE